MSVQFLAAWNGYEEDQVVHTLSGAEETRLIGLGICRAFVSGQDGRSLAAVVQDPVSGAQFAGQAPGDGNSLLAAAGADRTGAADSAAATQAAIDAFLVLGETRFLDFKSLVNGAGSIKINSGLVIPYLRAPWTLAASSSMPAT